MSFASSADKIRCPLCKREIDPYLFQLHFVLCYKINRPESEKK